MINFIERDNVMIELTKGFDEYVNQIVGRQNSNNLPDSNFKDGLFELDKNKYQLYNPSCFFKKKWEGKFFRYYSRTKLSD